jgi:hypothetical protein
MAAVTVAAPAGYANIVTERAYASTFDSSDDALLDSLDTDEGTLSFSRTRSSATGRVDRDEDEVTITAKGKESNYKITIDGHTDTGECEKTVDLDKGRNTIKVRVEDPDGDKSSVTYYMYITRGSSSYDDDDDDDEDDDDSVYLDDITVNGSDISFSKNTRSYNVEVADSVDEVRIKAEPDDDDDTVEIDGSDVDEDDGFKKWVSLNRGKNVIKINVEDDDSSDDRTYTLNIYRGEKAPSGTVGVGEVDDNQDSIYLDTLKITNAGGAGINYSRKVTSYETNVTDYFDNIIIKAEPDDSSDTVWINGDKVTDRNYNKRVNLQQGRNEIKVKVENNEDKDDDDYEQRTYTIIVNRGTGSSTNTGTTTNNNTSNTGNTNTNSSVKANQWVKNNYNQWTYNDDLGKPLINTWFFDKSYGKWYRFGYDGSMRTGWQFENGNTYYLNTDGSMQTGWKYIGSSWYYFNSNGTAKSGWFQDASGKWYYCYPGGVMAYSVTIDGYRLGADGAMR